MQVVKVSIYSHFKAFLDVPKMIYAEDKEYIPHIRQDIKKILWGRPGVSMWLIKSESIYIGRIASFINPENKGGLGFFESVNNQKVANLLFDQGIKWLAQQSVSFVEAPVNFGPRDKFWGLMISGFKNPSYQENYNPKYYQSLFEEYGFKPSFIQSTQLITEETFKFSKISSLAQRIKLDSSITISHIDKSNLEKYAEDFVKVYNSAWREHEHYIELKKTDVLNMMNSMRFIMRENLIWFTYKDNEPIAFYVSIIEVNEILKLLNGNMNWLGKMKFALYLKIKPITKIRGLVFGVVPEYQGKGIFAGMLLKVFDVMKNDSHIVSNELAWIGDFNPKMLNFLNRIGAKECKQHVTYKKKI